MWAPDLTRESISMSICIRYLDGWYLSRYEFFTEECWWYVTISRENAWKIWWGNAVLILYFTFPWIHSRYMVFPESFDDPQGRLSLTRSSLVGASWKRTYRVNRRKENHRNHPITSPWGGRNLPMSPMKIYTPGYRRHVFLGFFERMDFDLCLSRDTEFMYWLLWYPSWSRNPAARNSYRNAEADSTYKYSLPSLSLTWYLSPCSCS